MSLLRRLVLGPVTFVAALVAGLPVAFFGLSLGLILDESMMYFLGFPVAFGAAGVWAGVAAKWTSDAIAVDRSRARLFVNATVGAVGGVLGGAVLTTGLLLRTSDAGSLAALAMPLVVVVVGAPAYASLRKRDPQRSLRREARWTLPLLLAAPVALAATVGIGCALGRCGA